MAYQALYRAWRPGRFADVVGQEPIVTTLIRQIETGRVAHAYLFCGSRGTGKTTTAKVFARAINCANSAGGEACGACEACVELSKENNMDVVEIDAASNNGVDEIRALREKVVYPPSVGRYKVYIIDEVHMLSTGAFNALLKTLEEPPEHAVFILATTEPQKLPATILSRCQRYDFKRIPAGLIVGRLRTVADAAGAQAEEAALADIARAAEGGMRDALSLLDMCLSYGAGTVTSALVRDVLGASDRTFLFDFADALIQGDAARALRLIDRLIADGRDPAVFAREVVAHMRALLLAQIVKAELAELLELAEEDAARYREQAKQPPREALMRMMRLFMDAESDMKWAAAPRSVLELCAVRACHPEREPGDAALLERIAKLEAALASGVQIQAQAQPAREAAPDAPIEKPKKERAPEPAAKAPATAAAESEGAAQWTAARALVEERAKASFPLIREAAFKGLEGDVAVLELPRTRKMYRATLDKAAMRAPIEQALSEAFGRAMSLKVIVEGDRAPGAQPPVAPAQGRENLQHFADLFGREKLVILDDE